VAVAFDDEPHARHVPVADAILTGPGRYPLRQMGVGVHAKERRGRGREEFVVVRREVETVEGDEAIDVVTRGGWDHAGLHLKIGGFGKEDLLSDRGAVRRDGPNQESHLVRERDGEGRLAPGLGELTRRRALGGQRVRENEGGAENDGGQATHRASSDDDRAARRRRSVR